MRWVCSALGVSASDATHRGGAHGLSQGVEGRATRSGVSNSQIDTLSFGRPAGLYHVAKPVGALPQDPRPSTALPALALREVSELEAKNQDLEEEGASREFSEVDGEDRCNLGSFVGTVRRLCRKSIHG